VLFRSAYIVDPRPVVERAHQVGAAVILDGYQSAGIIPWTSPRSASTSSSAAAEWLCGGPGNASCTRRPG